MALKLNFREITPEDIRILRMVALRNGKAEDYLCCDVTGLYPGAHHNEVQRL